MATQTDTTSRWGVMILRLSFLLIGLLFLPLGIVWLPVIGLFVGLAFIALAFSPNLATPYTHTVQILLGSRRRDRTSGAVVAPVAILSNARGENASFDARTVDAATVRFGPNQIAPIHDMTDPRVAAEHLRDANGDGDRDVVLYFPLDKAGVNATTRQVCISGETVSGELIHGCTTIEPASL